MLRRAARFLAARELLNTSFCHLLKLTYNWRETGQKDVMFSPESSMFNLLCAAPSVYILFQLFEYFASY